MSLEYNLQFFAAEGQGGEKTEPATEKKLTDARKEGQVAKSREIANGLGLLSVFLVLKLWVGHMGYQFMNVFTHIYEKIPEVVTFWHGSMPQTDARLVFQKMLLEAVVIMAPLLLVGCLIAFLSDVEQWIADNKLDETKYNYSFQYDETIEQNYVVYQSVKEGEVIKDSLTIVYSNGKDPNATVDVIVEMICPKYIKRKNITG